MGDSSGGTPGTSGLSNLTGLLEKTRNKFLLLNPNDKRWPCPFCFYKGKSLFQCKLHIKREHPNLMTTDSQTLLSQYECTISDDSITVNDSTNLSTMSIEEKTKNEIDKCEENVKKKPTRKKLTRKCKEKPTKCDSLTEETTDELTRFLKIVEEDYANFNELSNNQQNIGSKTDERIQVRNKNKFKTEDSDRKVCNCGFIAKNNVGLRIHWGKQNKMMQAQTSKANQSNLKETLQKESNLKEYLEDFNILLAKCKKFIPVTRIIQKSVRIVVCQELTNLVNETVSNNDIVSWMRLLAFPYLVLNSCNKLNNKGKNYIRLNLEVPNIRNRK